MRKKSILKKFAIAIASISLALTAPVMSDASMFGTVQAVEAATVKTPSTVKLSKISAPTYNKIKVSWKKAKNATNYYVYYRKSGTKNVLIVHYFYPFHNLLQFHHSSEPNHLYNPHRQYT